MDIANLPQFTAGQRTWGGPRADAGAASNEKTPQQVIEEAEARGDDLQIIPESFRPSASKEQRPSAGVLPSDSVEGRFQPAERLPGLYPQYSNDSMGTLPDTFSRDPNAPHVPLHPRGSFDSVVSTATTSGDSGSVYYPRRVESIMGDEDRTKYHLAQVNQREAGGAYLTNSPYDPAALIYGGQMREPTASRSHESIASAGSFHQYGGSSPIPFGGPSGSSSAAPSPPPILRPGSQTSLAQPEPAFRSHNNRASHSSPLARMSVARSSITDSDGGHIEMTPAGQMPAAAEEATLRSSSKGRKLLKKKR